MVTIMTLFESIRPGDRVTFLTPHGQKLSGRATICGQRSNGGVVVNLGGRYGTPGCVTQDTLLTVKKAKQATYL
jgi:hypothetical protein